MDGASATLENLRYSFDLPLALRALCGYTHPAINDKCKELGRPVPHLTSFEGMRRFLETNSRLQFCDICVQGRKVGAVTTTENTALLAVAVRSCSCTSIGLIFSI
jgi:hypothetical protein